MIRGRPEQKACCGILGIYIAYTCVALDYVQEKFAHEKILNWYNHFKNGCVREMIQVWESGPFAAF